MAASSGQSSRAVSPVPNAAEEAFEISVRPQKMEEFVGQTQARQNLALYVEAARRRGEALDHVLLSGSPGLGKTTLAGILANEIGVNLRITSGPAIERAGDLVGLLTQLEARDVLFIDEIHRMPPQVAEYLHAAMEDFVVDIVIDRGPGARSVRMPLQHFTLVGATTREGLLPSPFRARFGIHEKLDFYPAEDLAQIVKRSARILGNEIESDAAVEIARRSRGTPRLANRFFRRVRDVAEVENEKRVTSEIAGKGLKMLGLDATGLDGMDRKILTAILNHGGGPVGVKTIAVSVGEEEDTIEDVYEPFLIQQGFLQKTPKGRLLGPKAYEHLGVEPPSNGGNAGAGGQEVLF